MRPGLAWLITFGTFLIWLTCKNLTVMPGRPVVREDKPYTWNALNYAADLIENEGWSLNTNERGIGGWSITKALRQADKSMIRMDGDPSIFIAAYRAFEKVNGKIGHGEGSLMSWEWAEHRTQKDVVILLRQLAEIAGR